MKIINFTKKFIRAIFISVFFLLVTPFIFRVLAEDYKADYNAVYFLDKKNNDTNVKFNITVTNLSNEVYVKKFSILYPISFTASSFKASDDNGSITPQVETDSLNTKITLEFSNPQSGRDSVNHFILEMKQEKLFSDNGGTWELIIPTFEYRKGDSYSIQVVLPDDKSKSISIAKPQPNQINGSKITWLNPQTKTIYAVFGDVQYYKVDLIYHLVNPRIIPVSTELAIPPDTLYQKIIIDKVDPVPSSVYRDVDGNYMARYFLGPTEKKTVTFSGYVSVMANPRTQYLKILPDQFKSQETYLTSPLKYWNTPETPQLKNIKTVPEIFSFVTNSLEYNYKKRPGDNLRYGAENILSTPNKAVCLEFTDLFVGMARKSGIPSREIEGYGFSQDPKIRPLSLISDVLHAWPEYFDATKKIWVPVDPTWQNTSGIDYFSSFDFNHIAFAIHSKQSDYPIAAGLYKVENSRDVSVKPVQEVPSDRYDLNIQPSSLSKEVISGRKYLLKFMLTNRGNTFIYNKRIKIQTNLLKSEPESLTLDVMAPYEKKEITVSVQSMDKNTNSKDMISVITDEKTLYSQRIRLVPYYYQYSTIAIMTGTAILFCLICILVYSRFNKSTTKAK